MADDRGTHDARLHVQLHDHPVRLFIYVYCVIYTVFSIMQESMTLFGVIDENRFVERLFMSALLAGVLLYAGRRQQEKRRAQEIAGM